MIGPTAVQEPPDVLALPQAATFSEGDLDYIMNSLATAAGERVRLARAIREDREIRAAVLADDRLIRALLAHDEAFANVSSHLFFTVLVLRARRDLQARGYTLEREGDFTMPVFDSDAVCAFLGSERIRNYLVGVLGTFVKTGQRWVLVRRRDGRLRRLRVNDLDLGGLIRYCGALQEEHRFELYRHIGDLCLFASGVFAAKRIWGHSAATWVEQGIVYYGRAAGHRYAGEGGLGETLGAFADNFGLAVKPLRLIAERYLGPLKDAVFGG